MMKNTDKRGGTGMFPLGCFPLWGRERGTLQAAAENTRITQYANYTEKEDFNKA
jgi:hypothetical protein